MAAIDDAVGIEGLVISKPLGFSNNYGLAVKRQFAEEHNLSKISDLISFMGPIRGVFSHEFVTRKDGVARLASTLRLRLGERYHFYGA